MSAKKLGLRGKDGRKGKIIGSKELLAKNYGRGKVGTNMAPIEWTWQKITLVAIACAIPYSGLIMASLITGFKTLTGVLVGLGVAVGLMALFLRWFENA